MKNKRTALLIMILTVLFVLPGCSKSKSLYEVAMITDEGTVEDGSFNESTYNGVKKYCEEKEIPYHYYMPDAMTLNSYMSAIDMAVKDGAKIVVCPGYMLEETVYNAAEKYPKVNFILIDGTPHNADYTDSTIAENVMCITFAEEEAGFLAGYMAVRDGNTRLGFLGGMAEDPVIRYGYGFVQGADYAAIEIGSKVYIAYNYTGTFLEDDEVHDKAALFYDYGVETIFACGGEMNKSVMKAAEEKDGAVIGVDVDQSSLSPSVVFSCTKNIEGAVYAAIDDFYSGTFAGGMEKHLDASDNAVGIPLESARFKNVSNIEYDAIYNEIAADAIDPYENTDIATTAELDLVNTEVIYQ